MSVCTCERVEVVRRSGRVDRVRGRIAECCQKHHVRERRTTFGMRSASLPVGKYARQITEYRYLRYERPLDWGEARIEHGFMVQEHRRETAAEVQRRLYTEAAVRAGGEAA